MTTRSDATPLWIGLLTAAALLSTLALACATPFAALAAIAAVHMRRRAGVTMLVLAWVASQAVGFGLLGYPCTASTLGWAAALGGAAVAAVLVAGPIERAAASGGFVPRVVASFLAAFIAFKLTILLWSLLLGGTAGLVTPHLLATQILRDGAFVIGLELLYRLLTAMGVPAMRPAQAVAA